MGYPYIAIGSTPLIDLRSDTVTADALMPGITAHDKNGNPITGTMDMAADVETGIYTPAEDTPGRSAVISFARSHNNPPQMIFLYDASGEAATTNTFHAFIFSYSPDGWKTNIGTDAMCYGYVISLYTSSSYQQYGLYSLTYPYGTGNSTSYHVGFWVSNSEFHPGASTNNYVFKAGVQYRWYAVFPQ